MKSSLTPKQQNVLEFIQNFLSTHGYSPSFEEVRGHLGASSVNSAKHFVDQLMEKGYLKRPKEKNQSRFLQPTRHTPKITPKIEYQRVQLAGTVAAGYPIEAIETRNFIDVPPGLLKPQHEYFALRVKGDSMIDDCIMEGDIVIIRKTDFAKNGETVVALLENDATIKRFYRKENRIELHPANANYNVIQVAAQAEFKILGVLASVIRKFE